MTTSPVWTTPRQTFLPRRPQGGSPPKRARVGLSAGSGPGLRQPARRSTAVARSRGGTACTREPWSARTIGPGLRCSRVPAPSTACRGPAGGAARQLVLHLRKPWRDGTTAFLLTPLELVEKLAALVIRPRVHTTYSYGVFAANSAWRQRSSWTQPRWPFAGRRGKPSRAGTRTRRPTLRPWSTWCPWLDLLARVFSKGGWNCACCGERLRLRSVRGETTGDNADPSGVGEAGEGTAFWDPTRLNRGRPGAVAVIRVFARRSGPPLRPIRQRWAPRPRGSQMPKALNHQLLRDRGGQIEHSSWPIGRLTGLSSR